MVKFGHTAAGMQRWRCERCASTGRQTRGDTRNRHRRLWFIRWLTNTATLAMIASRMRCSPSTTQRHFRVCWRDEPHPPSWIVPSRIVVLDGTSLVARQQVVLIAYGNGDVRQLSWAFTERETMTSWSALLARIPAPRFVVCDGQKGLLKAIRTQWPATLIQRCLIHIVRQSCAWLTRHPQTMAGQQLLYIMRALPAVRTRHQKRRWLHRFWNWCRKYELFLATRTRHPIDARRWWYTHRKLRRVRTLIERSLPYLFTFVRHPEVPRTSNHVEGGINARLHELFRAHRGMSVSKKRVLTAYFLLSKLKKKTTRNDY